MFVILVMALLGLGFLNPMWWVAAAVLMFGAVHYGKGSRDQGGNSEYSGYRDYRDRQNRWDRRYRRQRQGRWNRQDRRDQQHHR
ncbi:hypothetical protein [Streptomyces aureocirculatus]|uniref:hypothetical protein n=1 Tax=Streptomyces aureocirculatus TaxID=67275 RepID=UPI001CEDBA7D|nr:hypothetical protein [Streptomyces aureocirculatus]